LADDLFDSLGQPKISDLDGPSRHPANPGDRPRLLQMLEHFGREERIAVGAVHYDLR